MKKQLLLSKISLFFFLLSPWTLACGKGGHLQPSVKKISVQSNKSPENLVSSLYLLTPMGGWGATPEKTQEIRNSDSRRGVPYLNERTRAQYQVHFKDGLIIDSAGHPLTRDLRQVPYSSDSSGMITYIYVMDAFGQFFMATREEVMNHSSFFSGNPVAAAGTMNVNKGKVYEVTNYSGHYETPIFNFKQALKELKKQGISGFEIQRFVWDNKDEALHHLLKKHANEELTST